MADNKKAMEMYYSGFNCGQIVATFLSEQCGFDEKVGRSALGGFGMGLGNGEICGAIVGGIYSLGMYCNHCEYNDKEAKKKVDYMTKDLISYFLNKYGSLRCVHFTGDGDHNRCWDFIKDTDEFVKKLIEEDQLSKE